MINYPEFSQVSFEKKSLRIFGPKLLNHIPYELKSSKNLELIKRTIKHCDGKHCACKAYKCS